MKISHLRGHKIESLNNKWFYSDTKIAVFDDQDRPCGHCKLPNLATGHDACLKRLPGLMNACCGHGIIDECYVQFLDGFSVGGKNAKTIIDILKKER